MFLKRIFNSKQKTIGSAVSILAITVLFSRLLGVLRDRLLAGSFGASIDLDIYFAAFRIPDLIYSVIFAGGILVSLLPLFSDIYNKNKEKSWDFINNLINIFLIVFIVVSIIFFIFSPEIVGKMVSGFDEEAISKTIDLTRLIFLSVLFFGLSSIFSTVLNYFNRFVSYSLAPILYNLGIIFGIIFLAPHWGIFGVGVGVVLGSLLHLLIQIPPAIKLGYRYRPIINFKDPKLKEFLSLIIPRVIASSSSQINFIVITFIASGIGVGAISVFNLSNNLRYLPIGIIGVSFATAIFPLLSKLWVEGQVNEFCNRFVKLFNEVLYISFPIGVLIFVLRNEIVDIILKTGSFSVVAAEITAAALGLFFISTFAQCLAPILLRGFFSLKDTVTPTLIAIFFVIFNVVLSFFFVSVFSGGNVFSDIMKDILGLNGTVNFSVLGLVLAFNVGLLFEFFLLLYFFKKKIKELKYKEVYLTFIKVFFSSVLMGIFAFYLLSIINASSLVQFIIISLASFAFYAILTMILKMPEIGAIKRLIKRNGN
ncbi:MAG: murein biosynthesis integral membrane protein MurJ [Candidatus Pacebacteria bacterium]|nr:murein biosynthesis integral membrane protein MurJ [Candidatus Paceibacterota bacterium]MDD4737805.1 murein biosynthesis integral membrane protein MurJ [Candidatus Paceibacterota bacterium]